MQSRLIQPLLIAGLIGAAACASAQSMLGTYYVMPNTNPDVAPQQGIYGWQTGMVQNTLGPDGLPVVTTFGQNYISDVNGDGEIQWWTPGVDGTVFWKSEVDPIPFSNSQMYPYNSGHDGDDGYVAAKFAATFTTPVGGSVTFNVSSDDSCWVFLNNQLVADDGGIHGVTTIPTTISNLAPGLNTLDVFYADQCPTGAELDFSANVQLNAVPEPAPFAVVGVGALGLLIRKRRKARR